MKIILLALVLTACGTVNTPKPIGTNERPADAPNETDRTPDTPQDQKSILDDSTVSVIHTVALDTPKDMPVCGADNSKQLVYVKSESKFYSCESVGWSALEVSVKGDKGERGEAGSKGDKGEPGLPGNSNSWVDILTGYTWMLGAGVHYQDARDVCATAGWRMPTANEALAALQHGINLTDMWASDNNTTAGQAYIVPKATYLVTSKPVTDTYPFGCIKTGI